MKNKRTEQKGYYEIRRHGTEIQNNFPLSAVLGNTIQHCMHWHDYVEMLASVHGSVRVAVESEVYTIGPGDFILINAGVYHELFDGEEGGMQIVASFAPGLFLSEGNEAYHFQTVGEDAIDKSSEEYKAIWKAFCTLTYLQTPTKEQSYAYMISKEEEKSFLIEISDTDYYRYLMNVYQLMIHISHHKMPEAKRVSEKKDTLLTKCLQYIHEHYNENITAAILAEKFGVGESTIYRTFHTQLDMHLNTYLNQIRIQAAVYMLETQEDIEIIDVAYDCGFSSLSNFYRVFKEIKGQSPKQFKKHHKPETEGITTTKNIKTIDKLSRYRHYCMLPYDKEELIQGLW